MFSLNYVLILAAVAVIATGQILFKLAAKNLSFPTGTPYPLLLYINVYPIMLVLLALALYMLSTFAWIYALRTVPLSVAFMFNSLAFIIVPLGAFVVFNEGIPKYFFAGLIMIIGGIFLISKG